MTSIKTDKLCLPTDVQLQIADGWILDIDVHSFPIKYTLTHGKKSLSFSSNIVKNLCSRNYCIKLTHGRRRMIIPPEMLQALVDNSIFICWYDPNVRLPEKVHDFEIELADGWFINIDGSKNPTLYTITQRFRKKSMTFHANVMEDLCNRNYGLRLAKGRRQMVLPPHVLQGFVDNENVIMQYDNNIGC